MRKSESSKKWEWKREKGKMNKRIKKQIFRFLSFLPFFSFLPFLAFGFHQKLQMDCESQIHNSSLEYDE